MFSYNIFCGSAILFGGNLDLSFIGAGEIIIEMLLINISIEIIIETSKKVRGIGTLIGFITNGPEALCLIIGLLVGDILFAASIPLGSNFMNPVLLLIAATICHKTIDVVRINPIYIIICIILTAIIAASFYLIPKNFMVFG